MSPRRVAPLLAAAALLGAAAGCSHTLDANSASQAIARKLADSTGLPAPKVSCPPSIDVKSGGVFDCTTELDGQPLTIRGSMTDSSGGFTVKPSAAIVIVAKVVGAIMTNVDTTTQKAAVDCGTRTVLIQAPGQAFRCRATAGGLTRNVTVTVTDLEGHVHFEFAPPDSGPPATSPASTGSVPPSTLVGPA